MFHVPNRGVRGLKRVIGLPGETVELRENVVYLNGQAIGQEPLERARFAPWISGEHKLGQRVLREGRHWIAYSPGQSDLRTMPALTVPPGHYYVLGDQRDNSNDSRLFGMLDERHIQGRVEMHLRSARPREMMPAW